MSHPTDKITEENVVNVFGQHALTVNQSMRVEGVRDAGVEFARAILDNVPDCADRDAALRELRRIVMLCNSAIACEPQPLPPSDDLPVIIW